jgi:hypothetical protein
MKASPLAAVLLAGLVTTAGADEGRKVRIETTTGDTVEGTFRGATEDVVSVEVAGQRLKVPVDNVRLISFDPRPAPKDSEEAAPARATASAKRRHAAGSIEDAFDAFDELQSAARPGMPREDYADKLAELTARVQAFIDQDTPRSEARAEIHSRFNQAMELYDKPLRAEGIGITDSERMANAWRKASQYWAMAEAHIRRARDLHSGKR